MKRIYYHNLKDEVEESLKDFQYLTPYSHEWSIPLLVYTAHKEDTDKEVYQFIQAILPDEYGNRHMFLALKNRGHIVDEETLWTLDEMKEKITQILNTK